MECDGEGKKNVYTQLGGVTHVFKKERGSVAPAHECELSYDQVMPACLPAYLDRYLLRQVPSTCTYLPR